MKHSKQESDAEYLETQERTHQRTLQTRLRGYEVPTTHTVTRGQSEKTQVYLGARVLFQFDSGALRSEAERLRRGAEKELSDGRVWRLHQDRRGAFFRAS